MPYFDFDHLALRDFRPGIKSVAHFGEQIILAVMHIDGGKADAGHAHPFEQCGLVLEGSFSMTIGEESRTLGPGQGYFVPAGVLHGWSTENGPVRILDVSAKPPAAA
ncbi:MAG: cupin domain-containing protein [Deltaproteobacteria bacterium]|nr:cupin domain-containing protein [Deltaproteobacteria bacterium]